MKSGVSLGLLYETLFWNGRKTIRKKTKRIERQFETFNKQITITDIARARVEANAKINFKNFKEYQNHPDDFFLETEWNLQPGDILSSEGYYIRHVPTNDFIKEISDINDVANFIENDMADYLTKHQQKGNSND